VVLQLKIQLLVIILYGTPGADTDHMKVAISQGQNV